MTEETFGQIALGLVIGSILLLALIIYLMWGDPRPPGDNKKGG